MAISSFLDPDSGANVLLNSSSLVRAVRLLPGTWSHLRRQAGISQSELARRLGCSTETVSQLERGVYKPSGYLAIDYVVELVKHVPDERLELFFTSQDIATLRGIVSQGYTPRMREIKAKRGIMIQDRISLQTALEGSKIDGWCSWPDCGWWIEDECPTHSGTCPLAENKLVIE